MKSSQREIKFRCWDLKSKKMRAVNSIAFNYEHEAFNFNGDHLPKVINLWGKDLIEDKEIILHREPEEVILMQFTGLHDKNGKEIYEKDIFRHKDEVLSVMFPEDWQWLHDNRQNLEVIGNIYENPDLLKGALK